MKRLFLVIAAVLMFFISGCGEKSAKQKAAESEALKTVVTCTQCRAGSVLVDYKRVNQVLARCPVCKKVIHIMEARFGKKEKRRR